MVQKVQKVEEQLRKNAGAHALLQGRIQEDFQRALYEPLQRSPLGLGDGYPAEDERAAGTASVVVRSRA